jgi:hypothetical protein
MAANNEHYDGQSLPCSQLTGSPVFGSLQLLSQLASSRPKSMEEEATSHVTDNLTVLGNNLFSASR